jgi:DNA polymerase III sliding clamp (beta) subunit (PCNA family)
MSDLTISQFREYADNLGRFASARERKAAGPKDTASHKHQAYAITFDQDGEGKSLEHRPRLFVCKGCTKLWRAEDINRQYDPTDAVLIQATNGSLKFVAGTADSTLIVDAGATEQSGKALVSAKLLLNAAKSLRGKGSVEVRITPDGATVAISTGAEMSLPNVDDKVPDWVRVPKVNVPSVPFPDGFWSEASKVFGATTGDFWPYSTVSISAEGQLARLSSTDRYAVSTVTLEGPEKLPAEYGGSISSVFTAALRHVEGSGTMRLGGGAFWIVAGPYTAVTRLFEARGHQPGAIGRALVEEPATTVSIDKKVLVDMIKGVASQDEHNRVTLVAREAALQVHPYSDPGTSVKAPAQIEGEAGQIGVTSGYLIRLLQAHPGKSVRIGFSPGAKPLRLVDQATWNWTLLLAPVVQ